MDSITTPRYLPGEMLNLIAAQLPQEVYVLVNRFKNDRTDYEAQLYHPEDSAEVIGTFSCMKLANRAARTYVKQRLEPFLHKPGYEPYGVDLDADDGPDTEKEKLEDGTMRWTVYEIDSGNESVVEVLKQTVQNDLWNKEAMPLPHHVYRQHDSKCLCCNSADDLENAKHAEETVMRRSLLWSTKRSISNTLQRLEKLEEEQKQQKAVIDQELEKLKQEQGRLEAELLRDEDRVNRSRKRKHE